MLARPLVKVDPSKPSVKGSRATIMMGWTWKIMSMGLDSPRFDFCMISWERVHRIPDRKLIEKRLFIYIFHRKQCVESLK